ncbi:MAG: DinB family protein [Bacteroidota bacterium]
MDKEMTQAFIDDTIYYFELNVPRIVNCLGRLSEEQVWIKHNSVCNSVANLVVHLCGNITQYVISALGGEEDRRQRDLEFSITGGYTKAELIDKITSVSHRAVAVLRAQDTASLVKSYSVQGFNMSGVAIVIHVNEHFSYHVGQIAVLTKLMVEEDLGFYAGLDLDIKNEIEK